MPGAVPGLELCQVNKADPLACGTKFYWAETNQLKHMISYEVK